MDNGDRILSRLRAGERSVVKELHGSFYQTLVSFVKMNSGNMQDAEDLFQECTMYLYLLSRKANAPKIENFGAYFSTMYRNRWHTRLKGKKKEKQTLEAIKSISNQEEEIDYRYITYLKALRQLGDDCKQVLELYASGKKNNELAIILNTSLDYAKRKKYLCKEQLKKIVKQGKF